jgi:hypothetical protein
MESIFKFFVRNTVQTQTLTHTYIHSRLWTHARTPTPMSIFERLSPIISNQSSFVDVCTETQWTVVPTIHTGKPTQNTAMSSAATIHYRVFQRQVGGDSGAFLGAILRWGLRRGRVIAGQGFRCFSVYVLQDTDRGGLHTVSVGAVCGHTARAEEPRTTWGGAATKIR